MKMFKNKSVVQLTNKIIEPKKFVQNNNSEIVIMHGLLGRAKNWDSIG